MLNLKDLILKTPLEELLCDSILYGGEVTQTKQLLKRITRITPTACRLIVISIPGWIPDENQRSYSIKRLVEFYDKDVLLRQGPPTACAHFRENEWQPRLLGEYPVSQLSFWPRPESWSQEDLPDLLGADTGLDEYRYSPIPGLFLASFPKGYKAVDRKPQTVLPVWCDLHNMDLALDEIEKIYSLRQIGVCDEHFFR